MSNTNPSSGESNCYVFKSRLQEYAHKHGCVLPLYITVNEGRPHEPSFSSSVTINNVKYYSLPGFPNRKAAEQSAAEVALVELAKSRNLNASISYPLLETGLWKNLLQEYAQKMNFTIPSYVSRKDESFYSTVEIGGIQYIGGAARTKKEAEIKAARTALLAIHANTAANSETRTKTTGDLQLTVLPGKRKVFELDTTAEEIGKPPYGQRKERQKKKKWTKRQRSRDMGDQGRSQPTDKGAGNVENTSGFQVENSGMLRANMGGNNGQFVASDINKNEQEKHRNGDQIGNQPTGQAAGNVENAPGDQVDNSEMLRAILSGGNGELVASDVNQNEQQKHSIGDQIQSQPTGRGTDNVENVPVYRVENSRLRENLDDHNEQVNGLKQINAAKAPVVLQIGITPDLSNICNEKPVLCKHLLQQYAQRMKFASPSYMHRKDETFYCCTVEIGGFQYIGPAATTKLKAEFKAAQTALFAIHARTAGISEVKTTGDSHLTVLPGKSKVPELDTTKEEIVKPTNQKKEHKRRKIHSSQDMGDQGRSHPTEKATGNVENASGDQVEKSEMLRANMGGHNGQLVASDVNKNEQEKHSNSDQIGSQPTGQATVNVENAPGNPVENSEMLRDNMGGNNGELVAISTKEETVKPTNQKKERKRRKRRSSRDMGDEGRCQRTEKATGNVENASGDQVENSEMLMTNMGGPIGQLIALDVNKNEQEKHSNEDQIGSQLTGQAADNVENASEDQVDNAEMLRANMCADNGQLVAISTKEEIAKPTNQKKKRKSKKRHSSQDMGDLGRNQPTEKATGNVENAPGDQVENSGMLRTNMGGHNGQLVASDVNKNEQEKDSNGDQIGEPTGQATDSVENALENQVENSEMLRSNVSADNGQLLAISTKAETEKPTNQKKEHKRRKRHSSRDMGDEGRCQRTEKATGNVENAPRDQVENSDMLRTNMGGHNGRLVASDVNKNEQEKDSNGDQIGEPTRQATDSVENAPGNQVENSELSRSNMSADNGQLVAISTKAETEKHSNQKKERKRRKRHSSRDMGDEGRCQQTEKATGNVENASGDQVENSEMLRTNMGGHNGQLIVLDVNKNEQEKHSNDDQIGSQLTGQATDNVENASGDQVETAEMSRANMCADNGQLVAISTKEEIAEPTNQKKKRKRRKRQLSPDMGHLGRNQPTEKATGNVENASGNQVENSEMLMANMGGHNGQLFASDVN